MQSSRLNRARALLSRYNEGSLRCAAQQDAGLRAIPGFDAAFRTSRTDTDFNAALRKLDTQRIDAIQQAYNRAMVSVQAIQEELLAVLGELDEAEIRSLLTQRDEFHDYIVIHLLGTSGNQDAVLPLIERLRSDVALESVPFENTLRYRLLRRVSRWLRETEAETRETERVIERRMTATALSALGDLRAVEPLQELLGDPNEQIRTAAQKALARLGAG